MRKQTAKAPSALFSVTYGAGGSTQERTFETVDWILRQGGSVLPPSFLCRFLKRSDQERVFFQPLHG